MITVSEAQVEAAPAQTRRKRHMIEMPEDEWHARLNRLDSYREAAEAFIAPYARYKDSWLEQSARGSCGRRGVDAHVAWSVISFRRLLGN